MKVKNNKATATLTDVKNRIGDVFSLVDDFGEVTITSYNKSAYIISKFSPEAEQKPKPQNKPKEEPAEMEPPKEDIDFDLDIFLSPEPKITETGINELPPLPVEEFVSQPKEVLPNLPPIPTTTPSPQVQPEDMQKTPAIEIKPEHVTIDHAQNVQIDVDTKEGESNIKISDKTQPATNSKTTKDMEQTEMSALEIGDVYEEVPVAPPVNELLNRGPEPFNRQISAHIVEEAVTILANTTYSDLWNRANVKEKAWVEATRNLL